MRCRARCVWLGAALLLAGLVAGPFTSEKASATFDLCNTDPVVTLSDGTVVTLVATIYDDPSDVKAVAYTLHAPVGTSLTSVVYLDTIGAKEKLKFYADNPPNTYDTDTVVNTGASPIAVTAATSVSSSLLQGLLSGSASGYNKQDLLVHLSA